MTFRKVVKRLREDGWTIKEQHGSHVQMVHAIKKGKVTIPKHGNRDLKPGTLKAIWRQAGLGN